MRGLLEYFKLTLLLNFRSPRALIYGYLVPILFLIAFGGIFRHSDPPLLGQLGELLTISVLGGACFGMPTAIVADRERGIWRRYRLLPIAGGWLILAIMAARFLIVLSAALMQIALAALLYRMPMPLHPLQLAISFSLVTFCFLGMGLIIAMLADSVPAVQALGQAIFLPMIMIGGVGVPLQALPEWARHVAGFLPGKYAVESLQSCTIGSGLPGTSFDTLALLAIGAAAFLAGAKMFRWDAHESLAPRRRAWVILALLMWLSVGATAEAIRWKGVPSVDLQPLPSSTSSRPAEAYESITPDQIASIKFNDLEDDDSTVTPVFHDLTQLDDQAKSRLQQLKTQLADWPPARDPPPERRVRNLLEAASIADISQDPYEGLIARVVFDKLRADFPPGQLEKICAWIILHPADPDLLKSVADLGIKQDAMPDEIQDRTPRYAAKLLARLTGAIKN